MPLTTPEDWRNVLAFALNERLPRIEKYRRYYKGDHDLQFATAKFNEAFGDQLNEFSTNWCSLVVDSVVDRLKIEGFDFDGDEAASQEVWKWWQDNRMDARSIVAHTEAVKCETSYLLVRPPVQGSTTPRFTIEAPTQMIVAHDPSDRSIILAAYKRYTDIDGSLVEVVYLPETITTFRTGQVGTGSPLTSLILPPGVDMGADVNTQDNPIGLVPVAPLENNPDILTGGISDLRPAIALNDAANKFFADMLVASEFAAFPQRVMMGVELPDENDAEARQLKAALSRVWMFEDPDTKIAEFTAVQLENYVKAIETAVQHLAAQTRTPPHYLLAQLINISGDALTAAEAGLVHRAIRKETDFGNGWEDGQRIGYHWQAWRLKQDGDEAGAEKALSRTQKAVETQWADAEQRAPAAVADALQKKKQIGWPQDKLFREGGMSAQEVKKAMADMKIGGVDLSKLLTTDQVNALRAAAVPFEAIWKLMGFSDAMITELKANSPLPADPKAAAAAARKAAEAAAAAGPASGTPGNGNTPTSQPTAA